MIKNITSLLTIIVIIACNNEKKSNAQHPPQRVHELTYNEKLDRQLSKINNKNDSTFLGFVLGSSEQEVSDHLKQLIKDGLTKESINITWSTMGGSIHLAGHPFTLWIRENIQFKTLFHFKYSNGKLYEIYLNIYEGYRAEHARKLLTEKYGEEIISGTWWKNNTEINISSDLNVGLGDIIYRDLSRRIELENIETEVKEKLDSIKSEAVKDTKNTI